MIYQYNKQIQKESGMKITSFTKYSCGRSLERKVMVYLH